MLNSIGFVAFVRVWPGATFGGWRGAMGTLLAVVQRGSGRTLWARKTRDATRWI